MNYLAEMQLAGTGKTVITYVIADCIEHGCRMTGM